MNKYPRTWKRQLAFTMFLCLCFLGFTDKVEALGLVVWPFTLFIGAAFGMDWARGQGSELFKGTRTGISPD